MPTHEKLTAEQYEAQLRYYVFCIRDILEMIEKDDLVQKQSGSHKQDFLFHVKNLKDKYSELRERYDSVRMDSSQSERILRFITKSRKGRVRAADVVPDAEALYKEAQVILEGLQKLRPGT